MVRPQGALLDGGGVRNDRGKEAPGVGEDAGCREKGLACCAGLGGRVHYPCALSPPGPP